MRCLDILFEQAHLQQSLVNLQPTRSEWGGGRRVVGAQMGMGRGTPSRAKITGLFLALSLPPLSSGKAAGSRRGYVLSSLGPD